MVGFVLVRRGCVAARWRWCPVRGSATFSAKSRRINGARGRTFWRGISSAWRRCGWTSTRSTTSTASATTPVITGTYPRGSRCEKSSNANLSSGIWRTFSPRCSFPTRPEPSERYHDGQLFDWLIDFGRLVDWLIDWSMDWLIDWLIDWWIDWLIDITGQLRYVGCNPMFAILLLIKWIPFVYCRSEMPHTMGNTVWTPLTRRATNLSTSIRAMDR